MSSAHRPFRIFAVLGALMALPGCALMPTTGPSSIDIESGQSTQTPYALVRLTPQTVSALAQIEPKGLAGIFPQSDRRGPTPLVFGIGDVVINRCS